MIYRIEENDGTKHNITLRDRVQGEYTNNPRIESQWSADFSGCADLTFLSMASSVVPVKYNINPELKSKPGYLQFCRRMIVVLYIIEHLPDGHPSKRALKIKPENRRKIYPEFWHDISRSDYWNLPGGYADAPNDNGIRVIKENRNYTGAVKIKTEVTKTYKIENGKAEISSVLDKLDAHLFMKDDFKSVDDVQKFLNAVDPRSTYTVEEV